MDAEPVLVLGLGRITQQLDADCRSLVDEGGNEFEPIAGGVRRDPRRAQLLALPGGHARLPERMVGLAQGVVEEVIDLVSEFAENGTLDQHPAMRIMDAEERTEVGGKTPGVE